MTSHTLVGSRALPCVSSFSMMLSHLVYFFFFFNDTATTEIYTLSLHDALPISNVPSLDRPDSITKDSAGYWRYLPDRKSTRLNSSHSQISYAVFCLKKKKPIT